MQGIFDQVFLQIEALIANQVAQIKRQNKSVEVRMQYPFELRHILMGPKAILLVGGFGESKYLHDRVSNCHRADGTYIYRVQGA